MNVFALIVMVLSLQQVGIIAPSTGPPSAVTTPSSVPSAPDALFSRRALRQARLIIQMRMLQFHEERLECIRAALLRRLPPALRPVEPTTWSALPTSRSACLLEL